MNSKLLFGHLKQPEMQPLLLSHFDLFRNFSNPTIRKTFYSFLLSLCFISFSFAEYAPTNTECDENTIDPIAICIDYATELDFSGTKAISPFNVNGGSFDPDGNIIDFSVDPDFFTCDDLGVNVVTLTVEDNDGNTATCTANVTISTPSNQSLACFSQVNVSLDINGNATITPDDILAFPVIDPCGLLTVTPNTFTCDDIGQHTVIVEDGTGNSCWSTVIIEDKIPPEFIYPDDVIVECGSSTDPSITGEPVINDNCGLFGFSYEDLILNLPSGNIKILREWTIIDWLTGDIDQHIQVIQTVDNQSPIAICYANVNVSLDQFGNATITPDVIDAGSNDDCSDVTLSLDQSTFDCSDVDSTITVILTVTDESGNTNQCWSDVLIEDKMAPTAVCQAQVNVSLGADGTATITPDVIDAGSYDNCGPITFELSESMFDCTDIGDSIIVILTVTDASGNSNECWSQIIVEDKLAPDVTCPADITIDCADGNNLDPAITGTPLVVDNCDLIGYSYEDLILPIGGPNFKVLRTWTVVDWYSGSIQECIQVISVFDQTPPTVVCIAQLNASLDFNGTVTLTPEDVDLGTTDDCGTVTLDLFPNTFDCGDIGDTTIWLTAYDDSQNQSQCLVNVTIEDKLAPVAVCQAVVNVSLGADGTATITPDVIDAGSYDNCGPISFDLSETMFDCTDVGDSIVVILTVTDAYGNSNNCWSQIIVEDKIGPNVICPDDITIDCVVGGNLDPSITGLPVISDNCDLTGYSYEDLILPLDGSDFKVLRTWDVIDWNSGIIVECIQVIKVQDTTPPDIICFDELLAVLDSNGNLTLFPEDFDFGTTDDCGSFELSIDQSEFDCSDVGQTTITLTATDENQNQSQCTTTLTIQGLDSDGDGFSICEGDCDDSNNTVYLGAPELCGDNLDNNCDGEVDEDCYCPSYGQSTQNEWIESISVNSDLNLSGDDGGYGDYTSTTLQMNTGQNSIQLVPGFSGSKRKEYWSVWIDFNHNFVFDPNEEVLNENSKNAINEVINIPITALFGPTTMRVAMKYNQYSDPCEIFTNGEVEDYTVHIDAPNYCSPGGQSTVNEWIQKVKLKSINNNSGDDNGYADYSGLNTSLNPGQSKNINLNPGFSGGSSNVYWRVWVDWNEDGDFTDSGELEVEVNSSGNVIDQISVPNSATSGNKLMRVGMKSGGYPTPCELFAYGEVEDYTIIVAGNNPFVTQSTSLGIETLLDKKSERFTDIGTGTRSNLTTLGAIIYPNPARNVMHIELETNNLEETSIMIYNHMGQMIHKEKFKGQKSSIDLLNPKFMTGMYILSIQQGNKTITKKVLITK